MQLLDHLIDLIRAKPYRPSFSAAACILHRSDRAAASYLCSDRIHPLRLLTAMEEEAGAGSHHCNNNSQQMPPPVMSSEALIIADETWTLDDLSTLLGADGFLPPLDSQSHPDNYYWTTTTTTDTHQQHQQINGGTAAAAAAEGSLLLLLDGHDTHHELPPPPPPEEKQPAVDVLCEDDDDERARMALAADVSAALSEDEMATVMMTLPDMLRMAEECGNQATAGSYWSLDERKHLLYRLHRYAKDDNAFRKCFIIAFYLSNKTAKEVALRYRWLLDKEKPAKQAQLVAKDSDAVKLNKQVQGTKGAKKNNKMYPLSKEVLDAKGTRELLRDSIIFMQQIEENIKTGKLDDDTADYFYFVKTSIDAIGKRENKFCRISIPMPPIDEQGLEGILRQSRHSSSGGEEAV